MAINLFIVGNGFDLAHGLKTSYNHFIDFLIEDMFSEQKISSELSASLDRQQHNDLFGTKDYNTHIKSQALSKFNLIDNYTSHELSELKRTIRCKRPSRIAISNDMWSLYWLDLDNRFLKSLLEDSYDKNWVDIECFYYEHLSKTKDNREITQLNKHFKEVRELLLKYLNTLDPAPKMAKVHRIINEWQKTPARDNRKDIVLNFNYTNTVEQYFSRDNTEIIHVHGQLNNKQNPPVFGYSATDTQLEELKTNPSNSVMDFIKDILYFVNDNKDNILYRALPKEIDIPKELITIDKEVYIYVKILGHSMGMSDTNLLRKIFTHEHVQTIESMYFDKDCNGCHVSYIDQVKNIERIAPEARHKIIKFNASKRMPQFNDN